MNTSLNVFIDNLDKKISYMEKLWFHRWLRWEIALFQLKFIHIDSLKYMLGFEDEDDEFTFDRLSTTRLFDYVAGKKCI